MPNALAIPDRCRLIAVAALGEGVPGVGVDERRNGPRLDPGARRKAPITLFWKASPG